MIQKVLQSIRKSQLAILEYFPSKNIRKPRKPNKSPNRLAVFWALSDPVLSSESSTPKLPSFAIQSAARSLPGFSRPNIINRLCFCFCDMSRLREFYTFRSSMLHRQKQWMMGSIQLLPLGCSSCDHSVDHQGDTKKLARSFHLECRCSHLTMCVLFCRLKSRVAFPRPEQTTHFGATIIVLWVGLQ